MERQHTGGERRTGLAGRTEGGSLLAGRATGGTRRGETGLGERLRRVRLDLVWWEKGRQIVWLQWC